MRTRYCLTLLMLLACSPSAIGQQRTNQIASKESIVLAADTTELSIPNVPSISSGVDVPRFAERHPVLTGATIGALIGLGIWYYSYTTDEYCEDPDMISCEATVPIAVLGGAGIGGLAGYLVDGLRKRN